MVQRRLIEIEPIAGRQVVKLLPKERGELMREIMQFAHERGLDARFDAGTRRMMIGVDHATR